MVGVTRRTGFLLSFLPIAVVISTGCSRKPPPSPTPAASIPVAPPAAPKVHAPLTRTTEARDGSTVVVAKLAERTVAYIADEDDSSVRAVDIATSELLSRTPLEGCPGQMIVDKAGRLLVALRTDQSIAILEATSDARESLDATAKITTSGAEPLALAITPDDATLIVTTAWGHSLEGYALGNTQRRFAVDLAREPRSVTVSSDGKTAFVAHAAANHLSAIELPATTSATAATAASEEKIVIAEPKKIDLGMSGWTEFRRGPRPSGFGNPMLLFKLDVDPLDDERSMHFMCGTGRMGREITFPSRVARQSFALVKIRVPNAKAAAALKLKAKQAGATKPLGEDDLEERILAPHVEVATGDALVRSSGYGGGGLEEAEAIPTEMFDIDVVDASKRTRTTQFSALVGSARTGPDACRLPRAAVVDQNRNSLFVTCLGVDKIMEYDASTAAPMTGFKRSIDVASGPTGIAIDPSSEKAVVWSSFDRVVNVFSIIPAAPPPNATDKKAAAAAAAKVQPEIAKITIPAPSTPLTPEAALGEKLFHKAGNTKISKDGRACASCHPDGRDDGLVWSTPDGPRQTILLAGRVEREAPFGWLGKHSSLKEHITITMKNLKGSGASDEEMTALVAWLRAMPAPPRAKNVALGQKEQHGKDLFNSSQLQCASCHAEKTGFSDREAHDVASATGADVSRQFLVPSLRFVGGSSPYFHDGRYASLGELLQKNDKMGDTKSLSQDDRDALEAYLRTL